MLAASAFRLEPVHNHSVVAAETTVNDWQAKPDVEQITSCLSKENVLLL